MNIKKEKIFFIFILSIFTLLINNKVYAGEQHWNSLNYDVKLNSDGSMDVVETWDIWVSKTNTLFKNFDVDESKYSSISNVKIVECINENEYNLTQIYEQQYHVDSGCYYAMILPSDSSKYEIAWNVGADNTSVTKKYKIYYTVNDVVKIYNDCTELYWQFLSNKNTMEGKDIYGTITLPKEVSNIEKLRVWAHGNLSGKIEKTSENTVIFNLSQINSNEMLEVRIVTDENIYESCTNKVNKNMLNKILEEEQKWADKANAEREAEEDTKNKLIIIFGVIGAIYLIICILLLYKIIKYKKIGKELENDYSITPIEMKYFRDIPNEKNATPARASYMYNYNINSSTINKSNVFSATLLNFALKKIIEFETIDNGKDTRIIFKNDIEAQKKIEYLHTDEKVIYDLLKDACNGEDSITINEFTKYSGKNYDDFIDRIKEVDEAIDERIKEENINIDNNREKISRKWSHKKLLYIVGLVFTMPLSIAVIPILIEFIICIVLCSKNEKKLIALTENGYKEKMQWIGLKNYMKDFSLLKDREVPDLILWEKYLVYATTFGISKKVLEQLKVVYPELNDPNFVYGSEYSYMHSMSNSNINGINSISNLTHSIDKIYRTASSAYNSAHSSSSGSGGGGGFSSGGGGGRPEVEAVEAAKAWEILRRKISLAIKGGRPEAEAVEAAKAWEICQNIMQVYFKLIKEKRKKQR